MTAGTSGISPGRKLYPLILNYATNPFERFPKPCAADSNPAGGTEKPFQAGGPALSFARTPAAKQISDWLTADPDVG
jgi:hypothetical protein